MYSFATFLNQNIFCTTLNNLNDLLIRLYLLCSYLNILFHFPNNPNISIL